MNNNPVGKNQRTLTNLTKKSAELEAKHKLRVNATSQTHMLPIQSDKASKHAHGTEGYTPRIRAAEEALPPANDLWQRDTYRVGDGEVRQVVRPGSQDAMKLPSKGHST